MNHTRRFNYKRLLFRLGLGVVLIVLLFSVMPYLIRPAVLKGDRYEFAFADSHFAVVENTELHYRLWDDGGSSRGNVLLVHGFGGSTFSWRFTAPLYWRQGSGSLQRTCRGSA